MSLVDIAERRFPGLSVYLQKRVLLILFLGFSSGLPLALSGSTLLIWMTDRGVDLKTVGLFALAGTPYTFKFLWAPLVDAWQIPVLSRLLGRRRGWMVFTQLLLIAAILWLATLDPVTMAPYVALGAVLIATASATQDIIIDAFRVESLEDSEQAAGLALYVPAYRVALLVSTAGAVGIVHMMEKSGVLPTQSWPWAYMIMAALVVVGLIATLVAREPDMPEADEQTEGEKSTDAFRRLMATAYESFHEFLTRDNAVMVLIFVVVFKLCDALAGVMTGPFVIDIGFDKGTYVEIVKGVGLIALLLGGLAGGWVAKRLSMYQALWIAGIIQMASNLVFSWQAMVGVDSWALTVTICVENFTGGIGTVIFLAYLSSLCTNALHTATQYALLSALATFGRTTISSGSGFIVESTGWEWFFVITALTGIPALLLLWWLKLRGHFAGKEAAPVRTAGAA
ncbi:MAG: MFS transporter [Rhodobiaceae bacterium]|nr:MFS transporter [Rhodobiaceae bacterium]MCC0055117.1 MFS transporter [Rhodobiaceae bacterium]